MRETLSTLFDERMIRIILSQPKKKDQEYQKITFKWISDKKRSGYQVESFTATQVFHRFVSESELVDEFSPAKLSPTLARALGTGERRTALR